MDASLITFSLSDSLVGYLAYPQQQEKKHANHSIHCARSGPIKGSAPEKQCVGGANI